MTDQNKPILKSQRGDATIIAVMAVSVALGTIVIMKNLKTQRIMESANLSQASLVRQQSAKNSLTLVTSLMKMRDTPEQRDSGGKGLVSDGDREIMRNDWKKTIPALYPDPYLPIDNTTTIVPVIAAENLGPNRSWAAKLDEKKQEGIMLINDNVYQGRRGKNKRFVATSKTKSRLKNFIRFKGVNKDENNPFLIKSANVVLKQKVREKKAKENLADVSDILTLTASIDVPPPPSPTCSFEYTTNAVHSDEPFMCETVEIVPDGEGGTKEEVTVDPCGGNSVEWDVDLDLFNPPTPGPGFEAPPGSNENDYFINLSVKASGIVTKATMTSREFCPDCVNNPSIQPSDYLTPNQNPDKAPYPADSINSIDENLETINIPLGNSDTDEPGDRAGSIVYLVNVRGPADPQDLNVPGGNNCSFTMHIDRGRDVNDPSDSYAPESIIKMANGEEKRIDSIKKGDMVWNPKLQKATKVKSIFTHFYKKDFYKFSYKGKSLTVTNNHPFITEKHKVVLAKDLTKKHKVLGQDYKWVSIDKVEVIKNSEYTKVYDLILDSDLKYHNRMMAAGDLLMPGKDLQDFLQVTGGLINFKDIIKPPLNLAEAQTK